MRGSGIFWRALAAARAQNLAAAGEAAPIAGQRGATRRAVLKALAAAGLAPALPRHAEGYAGGRAVIVGGGIAGLSALHHLREAGVDAHLFEARNRSGGRMFTHRPATGPAFEAGGQLVNSDHHDMQALTKRFGVPLIDRKSEAHETLILADGRLVSDSELAEALRPIAAQIGRDADRLDKDYGRVAPDLDRISIRDYLDLHRAMIGDAWVRHLLEATSRTEYGVEPANASAIELIFNLPTVDGRRAEVLGGSDERYVMEGGSSALIDAMTARYGARITTGRRLGRVTTRGAGLRLDFLDGSSAEAETLIVAVPAPLTRQIDFAVPLPAAWRGFIAEMDLGHNEKVQSATDAIPWKGPMGVGGELWQTRGDAGWALGWDGSVHLAGRIDPVWTWFLGGDEVRAARSKAPSALAGRFAESASPAIPGLQEAATGPFARTNWHAHALTLGAYSNFKPGQLTRFAHLLCVESDDPAAHRASGAGRVRFAGEHLSDAFPGYMNGAAQTGRMAAEAITGRKLGQARVA
ncbi:flavin monoamine oxidase family protein [Sphingomonas sp. M1-B02]|uniref:flavin monoamine oxidase family protein n=1 Tax=Sphingomonas sp. M1-B02 TaxID=3114300 RepID=UPI002240994F|nr:NAD(P)/FAD-dependent oxidoreductase [Sphingomonas sp. S6-11]UZK65296.1 FAD-dependent oxidoreductase [Sphingomonas sp. S6-11]